MSTVVIIIILALVIIIGANTAYKRSRKGSACCGDIAAAEKKLAVKDRNKKNYPYTLKLKIMGMTCNNCKIRVENALNAIDGVWATVDLSSGIASVLLKNEPNIGELCAAVAKAGYGARDAASSD